MWSVGFKSEAQCKISIVLQTNILINIPSYVNVSKGLQQLKYNAKIMIGFGNEMFWYQNMICQINEHVYAV